MFAPPVAKPKAMQPERPKIVAQRPSQSAVGHAHMLEQRIGNQAMLQLLAQRATVARGPARSQTNYVAPGNLGSNVAPPIVHEVLRSPGQPLDAATREFMEPRFGHDFSRVRVHCDAGAAAAAEAVHARAYTAGSNVAFGANEYAPANARGRELLAHELAHTIQQERGAGSSFSSDANGRLEASADAAARAVTAGQAVAVDLPASGIGLARKPADDDRAKAIAEAQAVAARIDQELADADKDDEPVKKPTARPNKASSRFSPGGFTDKDIDALSRKAEDRIKLGSMALTLAERQARRREFWDRNPSYNSADVKEAFDLDLYWDPKEEGFIRQPYVDKSEAVVLADPEAHRLYNEHLWDLTENKPVEESRFTRAVHVVCEHTEPCSSNLEQFRQDRAGGMSRDEALNRGMARLAVFAETMALPGPGPSGPIAIGPDGEPIDFPFNAPATEGARPGGAETPAASTPEPLLATGSRSGRPPQGEVGTPAEQVVHEPRSRSDPQRQGTPKPAEQEPAALEAKAAERGPYADIADRTKVEAGRPFQEQQKAKILAENAKRNGGVLRSDNPADPLFGKDLVAPPKGPFEPGKFPTVPDNQAQIDHLVPRIGPDGKPIGTNSYGNAQVVSAKYNNMKSNR